ncbi:type II secretion system secretin GspD [Pseudomonas marginalis]|uniref:type II secretion system secretin GspD n=1 Tax=Pseudomonas fluorescens group TaxID=136843 RepID=UPI001F3A4666|nr:type II secretion system secretin GspD [Pseudomonas marginalis]MCF5667674.1 type II secretion system protein GspD [Pseudomonas marginalis]
MKWSVTSFRRVAPLLVLALSACSNPSTTPLLVDSELGQPLADTQRSGENVLDRQRDLAPKPPVQHRVTNSARGHAPAAVKARNPLGDQPVQLNFVDADIQAVVRALSRATGQQFLVDPRVKGNLTLVSEGQVPAHQAYDMLLAALRMQGFSVVDVGGVAQVVPEADAKLLGGPIYSAGSSGMQTRTFRLQYENAVNLIPVLRPIVSPNNPINAYPGNNSIVITDYAENLARVAQIISGIDTPSAIDTDVVMVQNGIAVDIAAMVSELLETQGADQTQKINVIGDPRSNSIIIRSGSPERTELARNLIYKLDNAQSNPSNMHVVYLRNAQASKLAQSLRGLLTGESDSGVSDDARGKLSAMGGNGKNTQGTSNAQNSSGTPTGSGVQSGYGQTTGSTPSTSGTSTENQDTAFSAGGVTIQADATTNTLLISAPDPLYRNLREVIDMLDQRRAQVVIESLIVEVGEDDATEFGVQWQAGNLAGKGGFGGVNLGGSGVNSTPTSKTSIDVLPKGLNVGLVNGTVDIPGIGKVLDLKVLARALKSKGGTNVLSTPNLLTLDNEAASIFVGQTIPFVTGSYVTGGGGTSNNPFQTVQREEVGLKLNVRPQISEGGTVKLDIYQEVSTVDTRASVDAGTVTNKRAIDTSILLDDGQIMVLGGLLQDGYSQSNDAVPWLSDIPGLGALFRNEKRSVNKTNLMVFLRPYIIRDSGAGRSITLNRYEFMRRAQGGLQPEHSWAMPDVQAPQLPSVEKAIPGGQQQGPRAVIRAVPK